MLLPFNCKVMLNSLWSPRPRDTRLLCSSQSPRVCSNSCPLSWLCCPTMSSSVVPLLLLLSVFPSIGVFSNESVFLIKGPKYWSFNSSTRPSNEYSELISFGIDWFDLLKVQETLQHHNSKASVLWSLAFMVQLSHPYITTGKTIALTRWTFVGKVIFLLFF